MFLNEFPTNQPETRQRLVEAEDSMLKYFVVPMLIFWLILIIVLVVTSFFTVDKSNPVKESTSTECRNTSH